VAHAGIRRSPAASESTSRLERQAGPTRAFAAKARAGDFVSIPGNSPFASNAIDQNQVDAWLTINADNTGWVKSGAIFQGTGSTTGILMIAAEELEMDLSQLSIVQDDTDVTPNTGQKDASNTIVGGAGVGRGRLPPGRARPCSGLRRRGSGCPRRA
jgi:CO/xanthine dehydrogenase Mo-binding subunit